MFYIGLDIGGTKCAMTLAKIDCCIEILFKKSFLTNDQEPLVVLNNFSSFIEKYLSYSVKGIGISCGGPLDSKKGIVMSPPSLPKWNNIEIVKYFEERFKIPTRLQNDANACAVAEWKFGAGKGAENMVFLTFGTGFGGGLILNGKLYSGTNDSAGEIGHIRLTQSGPIGYNKKGSCEGYCSGSGIKRLATSMSLKDTEASNTLLGVVGGIENINAKDIAILAEKGDLFCKKVYKKSAEMLGRSLSIIVDLLNPELIVIGGVYMRSEKLFQKDLKRIMKKECLYDALSVCRVVKAELGENVGDYAALAVAYGEF